MALNVKSMESEKLDIAAGDLSLDETPESKKLTRKILFKLDTRILPMLALLFLCSFLDRTNVGNAKIIGLEKSIHITDHQYDEGLVVFYATYIASEIPSNLVLKRISPSIWLPFLVVMWGILAMCLGFITNFASFMTVRALLGFAEGGLLPGMVLYLSGLYTRAEMALRIGLFYTAASLSGAFGGLLARGLSAIGTRGGLTGWKWIFIIEGLITVVAGVIAYFVLPNNLENARFLKPEERDHARLRLLKEKPGFGTDANGNIFIAEDSQEKFAWSEVRRGIFNKQVWLSGCAYFAILVGLYSFGLFLPTIINDSGFTKSANRVQLLTVPPYAVAAVFTVAVAIVSDKLKIRGIVMLCMLPVAIAGYAAIANVRSPRVQYGMTYLMAVGLYSSVPPVLSWSSNNSAGHYKRATTSALQLMIANSGGFVAAFIYPSKQGPLYHKGHTIVLGLLCGAWFLVLLNVINLWKINRDKAAGKYDHHAGRGDDRDPEFIMVL